MSDVPRMTVRVGNRVVEGSCNSCHRRDCEEIIVVELATVRFRVCEDCATRLARALEFCRNATKRGDRVGVQNPITPTAAGRLYNASVREIEGDVWLDVNSPNGNRAALNLNALKTGPIVRRVFVDWAKSNMSHPAATVGEPAAPRKPPHADTDGILDPCHCGAVAGLEESGTDSKEVRVHCTECCEQTNWFPTADGASFDWNIARRAEKGDY